jgi:hypothetical protein
MTDIAKAEQTIAALEDQRKALVIERQEQDDELKRVAFLAHAQGDVEARKRLTELREEAIRRDQKFKEIEAATATAREKLQAAQAARAREAALENAERLGDTASLLRQVGADLDGALFSLVTSGEALSGLIDKIHSLGVASPNHAQMLSMGERCIGTMLQQTVWSRAFSPIAPRERRTFAETTAAWAAMIEGAAERVAGEPKEQVA